MSEKSPWTGAGEHQREVHTERDDLANRADRLGVLIAGADQAETEELRDLVQWQEERAVDDRRRAAERPANIRDTSGVTPAQVSERLREANEYRKRKAGPSPRKYY